MKIILLVIGCALAAGSTFAQVNGIEIANQIRRDPLKGVEGWSVSVAAMDMRKPDQSESLNAAITKVTDLWLRELEVPILEPLKDKVHDERGFLMVTYGVVPVDNGTDLLAGTFLVEAYATMKNPRTGRSTSIPVWGGRRVVYCHIGENPIWDPLRDILKDFALDYFKAQKDK